MDLASRQLSPTAFKAGMVELPRRAHFRISERGRKVLAHPPERIDIRVLDQFPEFVAWPG